MPTEELEPPKPTWRGRIHLAAFLVSIPAGLLDMRFRNFMIASTIGTALWTAILAGAGFKLQENFHQIGNVVGPASNIVIALLVGIYFWRLLTHRSSDQH